MICEEPRMSPIRPSDECVELIDKSRDFVRKKLDGQFLDNYSGLGQSADYIANRRAIINSMAQRDLDGCKVALRTWCKMVIDYTMLHRRDA